MKKIIFGIVVLPSAFFAMQSPARVYDQEKSNMLKSLLNVHDGKRATIPYANIMNLVIEGADPDIKADCGYRKDYSWLFVINTAMGIDGSNGHYSIILLEYGADPNKTFCLHQSSLLGQYAQALILIKYGADIHLQDTYGCVPLHHAVTCGGLTTIKILLDKGAGSDIHTPDKDGITPFLLAKQKDRKDILNLFEKYKK